MIPLLLICWVSIDISLISLTYAFVSCNLSARFSTSFVALFVLSACPCAPMDTLWIASETWFVVSVVVLEISEILSDALIITCERSSTSLISMDTLSTISLKLPSSSPNSFFFLIGILCVKSPSATACITLLIFLISFVNIIVTNNAMTIPMINEIIPDEIVALTILFTTLAVSLELIKPTSVQSVISSLATTTCTVFPLIFSSKSWTL